MLNNTVLIEMTQPSHTHIKELLENYFMTANEKADEFDIQNPNYSIVRELEHKQDEYAHDIVHELAVYIPLECMP